MRRGDASAEAGLREAQEAALGERFVRRIPGVERDEWRGYLFPNAAATSRANSVIRRGSRPVMSFTADVGAAIHPLV